MFVPEPPFRVLLPSWSFRAPGPLTVVPAPWAAADVGVDSAVAWGLGVGREQAGRGWGGVSGSLQEATLLGECHLQGTKGPAHATSPKWGPHVT